jgi:hypothetical protein
MEEIIKTARFLIAVLVAIGTGVTATRPLHAAGSQQSQPPLTTISPDPECPPPLSRTCTTVWADHAAEIATEGRTQSGGIAPC